MNVEARDLLDRRLTVGAKVAFASRSGNSAQMAVKEISEIKVEVDRRGREYFNVKFTSGGWTHNLKNMVRL